MRKHVFFMLVPAMLLLLTRLSAQEIKNIPNKQIRTLPYTHTANLTPESYLMESYRYGDVYSVTFTKGYTIDIEIQSGDFTSSVTLYNKDFQGIASLTGANPRLLLTDTLTGTYYILVTTAAAGATGKYTIEVKTAPPLQYTPVSTLPYTDISAFTEDSYRSPYNYSSYAAGYAVRLDAGQMITIKQTSTDFKCQFYLLDSSLSYIGAGTIYDTLNMRMDYIAPYGGVYHILATTNLPGTTGDYTLEIENYIFQAKPVAGLPYGDTSKLDRNSDLNPFRSGRYMAAYSVELTQGQVIEINHKRLNATMDPYLSLLNSSYAVIENNDDGGGSRNSRINYRATYTGIHYILATTFNVGDTGTYIVTIAESIPISAIPITNLPYGDTSKLDQNSDLNLHSQGRYMAAYSVELTQGQVIEINHKRLNATMDPYLSLLNSSYAVIENNDDGGGSRNSRINYRATYTGIHYILATTYSAGDTGSYILTVEEFLPMQYIPVTALPYTHTSQLNTGSYRNPLDINKYADGYSIHLDSGRSILMVQETIYTNPDGRIQVLDSAFNETYTVGMNLTKFFSLAFTSYASGTYYILATTNGSRDTGSYKLEIQDLVPTQQYIPIDTIPYTNSSSLTTSSYMNKYTGAYEEGYSIHLTKGQAINLKLTADFQGWITYYDSLEGMKYINEEGAIQASYTGTYLLVASAVIPGTTGDYTISVDSMVLNYTPITPGTYVQVLNAASPKYPVRNGCYGAGFSIQLDRFQRILITQTSSSFSSYLYLLDSNFNIIANSNDATYGSTASIDLYAGYAGIFYIVATTEMQGSTGACTVKVVDKTVQYIPVPGLPYTDNGQLNTNSYLYPGSAVDRYVAGYSIEMEEDQKIILDYTSNDFGIGLIIFDTSHTVVHAYAGLDPISKYFQAPYAGTYYILATTLQDFATGNYNLTILPTNLGMLSDVYYIDPVAGDDGANDGLTPQTALSTIYPVLEITDSATVYIMNDVVLDSTLKVYNTITLLPYNGGNYVISRDTNTCRDAMVNVYETLYLGTAASSTGTLTLDGGYDSLSAGPFVAGQSIVNIYDGQMVMYDSIILQNNNTTLSGWSGAAVYLDGGIFDMHGGEIKSNMASYAGGVYNYEGIFTMYGGAISGNQSLYGGGLYGGGASGVTILSGGNISGNRATSSGGGIYNELNVFFMTEGALEDNHSLTGGAITNEHGTFNIKAGNITGNTASEFGAGIYNTGNGSLAISGGEISRNTADSAGGGIYMDNAAFTLYGGSITDNIASYAEGMFLTGGDFRIKEKAKIPANNSIWVNDGITIGVTEILTADPYLLTIVPCQFNSATNTSGLYYVDGRPVLSGDSLSIDQQYWMFAVAPDDLGTNWYLDSLGRLTTTPSPSFYVVTYLLTGFETGGLPASIRQNFPLSLTLTPLADRQLPSTILVVMGTDTLGAGDYTYNSTTGAVLIPSITADVEITATALSVYSVAYSLTNIETTGLPSQVAGNPPVLSITLVPENGYVLSENIDVTMGGVSLPSGQYSYNASTGAFRISPVTGDVHITASATEGMDIVDYSSNDYIVNIYPNPTSDMIYLEIGDRLENPLQVRLYDIYGKLLFQTMTGNDKTVIDMQDLAAGFYFIQLYNDNQLLTTRKVIKQ